MKYGVLSVIALFFACIIYAQDVGVLIADAEKLEKDLKEAEALEKYKEVLNIDTANLKAGCKAAELTGRIGARFKDEKQRTAYFTSVKIYAERVFRQHHDEAEANYAMANANMLLATVTKNKEKAVHLRDMKFYSDSALLINPSHAGSLYTLGKWNYEIINLNVAEKAGVKVLFGGMPRASLDEAILYFEKARSANPMLIVNYLDLANAYVQNHRTDKAIEVLNRMVKLPPRTQDDETYKAEGRTLLASLQ
ncbi:MAG TPA: tetratricopeptide repeat protein [Agriterribacter sp.]|nr:tetratricopeptide repeat protein [Agriterribacter sp.]